MINFKYKLDINGKIIYGNVLTDNRDFAIESVTKICERIGGSFLDIVYVEID